MTKIEGDLKARLNSDHLEVVELQNVVSSDKTDLVKSMAAIQKMKEEGLKLENFENEMRLEIADTLSDFLTTSDREELLERSTIRLLGCCCLSACFVVALHFLN
jgi:hypothetical protein